MAEDKKFDPVAMMDKLRSVPIGEGAATTYAEYLAEIPDSGIPSHHALLCDTIDEVFDAHDFADDVLDAERLVKKSSIMDQSHMIVQNEACDTQRPD